MASQTSNVTSQSFIDSRNQSLSQQNSSSSSLRNTILSPLQALLGISSQNSSQGPNAQSQQDLNPQTPTGRIKTHIQVFLDMQYKNYTRVVITDDMQASELCKDLKQKYAQASANVHSGTISHGGAPRMGTLAQDPRKQHNPQVRHPTEKRSDKDAHSWAQKEDYALYLVNIKATNQILFIRKLAPNDLVLRVYQKAVEAFKKEGLDCFKLVFTKQGEIDANLKQKGAFQQQFDEENQVVSQLGKSIINNKTYERKGKLYKKSLNSDKFKERQFVLDKDQLFYYKNEKQKDKNFNLIMLSNASVCILEHFQKQKHCFQIENENRKYILSTKSQYDLDQWVYAIQGQIKLSRDNKNLSDVNQCITNKEKDIATHDMALVQKIFKPKNAIFNPVQPILLDFVDDPFLNELLPNLTKYMSLCREKEYQRHALEKSKEIISQLKLLQKKAQSSLSSNSEMPEEQKDNNDQQTQPVHSQGEDYRKYKELRPEHKIQCLFSPEDFQQIQADFKKMSLSDETFKEIQLNPRLFNAILLRIQRILKYNYLDSLYQQKNLELLSIPCMQHNSVLPGLDFNATGPNIRVTGQRQANIFETLSQKSQKEEGAKSSTSSLGKSLKSTSAGVAQPVEGGPQLAKKNGGK